MADSRTSLIGKAAILLLGALAGLGAAPAKGYDVTGKGIADLSRDLAAGRVTSLQLVRAYKARIKAIDQGGPKLQSVLILNPDIEAQASAIDKRRKRGEAPRALEGIPILIKDNVETLDAMPTTAGSLALAANITHRDAPIVARLRAAGALILGKTNLSEWANFRSSSSISGWSGMGGLTRNPFALDRSACGSSSGSAAAVAASLAPAAIGTETDGSVTCPASMSGLVGLKPTIGLVSRTHIVPISAIQDTAGPITHTVADAALLTAVIAGADPADPVTANAEAHRPAADLSAQADSLRGARIGVLRFLAGHSETTDAVFAQALDQLRAAGAVLVEIKDGPDMDAIGGAESAAMLSEFKAGLDSYLASTPNTAQPRSLADVIAFNTAHADRELGLFGQDLMEKAQASAALTDASYKDARAHAQRLAATEGLDRITAANHLDALVAPTGGPAWLIDIVDGDHDGGSASTLPAVAGAPHLTVPMGLVEALPVGLSFIGPAFSEARLLGYGYAYEQIAKFKPLPQFFPSVPLETKQHTLLSPFFRALPAHEQGNRGSFRKQ